MLSLNLPSPIQELKSPFLEENGVRLLMKREDLIHPVVSGNKWRKLKYNFEKAKALGHTTLLSFGGAYSNHLHALAYVAKEYGLKSIGIIRGEELSFSDNQTLRDLKAFGMELSFISREDYKRKNEIDFISALKSKYGDFFLVPEGGSNAEGVKGCNAIVKEIDVSFDYLALPCGTGATFAGIVQCFPKEKRLLGFPAMKGGGYLKEEIITLAGVNLWSNNWELVTDYHFGGFGKIDKKVLDFIEGFQTSYSILLDTIYTGKMMYGLFEQVKAGYFAKGSIILAIHTGGLQGSR